MEYHVLIDSKIGDITGDGIPDRVSLYGDRVDDLGYFYNIIIEVQYSNIEYREQIITEVNGYNPMLFLGDFTKDKIDDILFSLDMRYNSMDSNDQGGYGVSVITYRDNSLEIIFDSDRYNEQLQYIVEYNDFYKVSIANLMVNELFILDISYKSFDYLSQYYNKDGTLIKPMEGKVLGLSSLIPIVSNLKYSSFDLLAIYRVIGTSDNDTLGYIENLLSWDGRWLSIVNTMACTTAVSL